MVESEDWVGKVGPGKSGRKAHLIPKARHDGPAWSYDYYPATVVADIYDICYQGSWRKGIPIHVLP